MYLNFVRNSDNTISVKVSNTDMKHILLNRFTFTMVGMPKDTIAKALEVAERKLESSGEAVTYEGQGCEGYHFIIEAVTNNRNRTRPEIKSLLEKVGYVHRLLN